MGAKAHESGHRLSVPTFSERFLRAESRSRWSVCCILVIGLVFFFWGRLTLPPGQFSNADVAGMTYNADLLINGELPYIRSIEGKAPGTFFITAVVFWIFDRSIVALWIVFLIWQLLGGIAVWIAARQLYGREAILNCAFATALFLGSAGQFDLNYSAWMTTAYIWAVAAALVGLRTGKARWHLFAGVCSISAFLLKRQAVMLIPLFPALFFFARKRKQAGATAGTWGWWSFGAFGGAIPLIIYYAFEGHLLKLVSSIFPVEAVKSYAAMDSPLSSFELIWLVIVQCYTAFPLAFTLSLASLAVVYYERRYPAKVLLKVPFGPQLAFILVSMFAGNLGGPRYYTHYLIQSLPGLALLAARPGLLVYLGGGPFKGRASRVVRWAILVLLAYSLGLHTYEHATGQAVRRDNVSLEGAREAGRYIAANSTEDETIMVWGWTAWPTYYWANRKAPVLGYKSLGLLTDPNTNSAFFRSAPIHFKRGHHANMLLKAFHQNPPAYFVFSSYYSTHLHLDSEPLREWDEFMVVLKRKYEIEKTFAEISVFGRRDRKK
ncbi:MAG: hypothetical protein ACI87A_003263, partial [Planctomycetota bacterium]